MLPFRVAPYSQAGQFVGDYAHVVIDGRRQSIFGDRNCEADTGEDNLLVVPVLPTFDTNSALATTAFLQELQNTPHRILFTRVPDEPSRNTVDMHEYLEQMGAPTFITQIPKLKVFERAALEGTTVKNISDSNSERAWTAYAAVGEEIVYQGQPLVN